MSQTEFVKVRLISDYCFNTHVSDALSLSLIDDVVKVMVSLSWNQQPSASLLGLRPPFSLFSISSFCWFFELLHLYMNFCRGIDEAFEPVTPLFGLP